LIHADHDGATHLLRLREQQHPKLPLLQQLPRRGPQSCVASSQISNAPMVRMRYAQERLMAAQILTGRRPEDEAVSDKRRHDVVERPTATDAVFVAVGER
jgi:hypothetical protein